MLFFVFEIYHLSDSVVVDHVECLNQKMMWDAVCVLSQSFGNPLNV